MFRLSVLRGTDRGQVYLGTGTSVGIGTAPDNEVRLSDPFASRHHGQLRLESGRWIYRDLGSTNGSAVEGSGRHTKLDAAGAETEVQPGDLILIGQSALSFSLSDTDGVTDLDSALIASRSVADLPAATQRLLRSQDDLALAYELEQDIGAAFEPEAMVDAVLDAMLRAFPASTHVVLLLIDQQTSAVRRQVARARGVDGRVEGELTVSMSIAHRVIHEGKSMLFKNAAAEFGGADSVVAAGLQSSLCAPLWTGDDTIGLVQVESRGGAARFTERDLERLSVFANRAATAIIACQLSETERRYHLLQDVAAMITHDLKGPLTGIVGFLELLMRERLDESQRQYVEEALASSKWLTLLVGAILDAAKLDAGELRLRRQLLAVRDEVRQGLSLISYQMREKDIRLQMELGDDLPPVWADRELFRRIIANLAGNSVALSPRGSSLTVSGMVAEESDAVVVSVADQGPGIPSDYQSYIFDKFFQAEKRERSREKLSVGLGLAFCKLAVEAQGGSIWVDSEVGRGARFSFSLPTKAPPPQASAHNQQTA
jgi:signal transduction histidine kinase